MAIIKAGTYVFVEEPTITKAYNQTLNYKVHYLTAENVYATDTFNAILLSTTATWGGTITCSRAENITEYPVTRYVGNSKRWQSSPDDSSNFFATDNTKLRTIIVETDQTVADDFYTWFTANTALQPKLSIDLTTLPGWANLSTGNHTIKIKAKGTGYTDSELSAGVVVSKAASTGHEVWTFKDALSNVTGEFAVDFISCNNGIYNGVKIELDENNSPVLYYKNNEQWSRMSGYRDTDTSMYFMYQGTKYIILKQLPIGEFKTWLQNNATKNEVEYITLNAGTYIVDNSANTGSYFGDYIEFYSKGVKYNTVAYSNYVSGTDRQVSGLYYDNTLASIRESEVDREYTIISIESPQVLIKNFHTSNSIHKGFVTLLVNAIPLPAGEYRFKATPTVYSEDLSYFIANGTMKTMISETEYGENLQIDTVSNSVEYSQWGITPIDDKNKGIEVAYATGDGWHYLDNDNYFAPGDSSLLRTIVLSGYNAIREQDYEKFISNVESKPASATS